MLTARIGPARATAPSSPPPAPFPHRTPAPPPVRETPPRPPFFARSPAARRRTEIRPAGRPAGSGSFQRLRGAHEEGDQRLVASGGECFCRGLFPLVRPYRAGPVVGLIR